MSRKLIPLSVSAALMGGTAMAEVPNVAVDIAPIHSLVARVMDGVGSPDLIVQSGASPHEYNLRPSQAQALQDADLVFWIGEDLTPWMEDAVATLATDATAITLLDADGAKVLGFRQGALFEAHDHGDEKHDDHEAHDDHDHEDHDPAEDEKHDDGNKDHDHDDHGHGETHEDHEDHADHDDHEDHAHGDRDPHAWLSIQNAGVWLNVIAAQLSGADPENAGTYFANAAAARSDMEKLSSEISAMLDPVRDGSFVVFHDAYQYFETDFDFPAAGAISLGDASDPSPARIAEIQARIRAEAIDCVLAEPQFNAGLVKTVLDGTEAKTGVIDPLGADLDLGPALYPQLLRNMAQTLVDCL